MSNVYIGLLGCGTVGAGVVELMSRRQTKISELTGLSPVLKRVLVRDVHKPRQVALTEGLVTTRAEELLSDKDISIVMEAIGGIEPAKSYILAAIRAGKHVITANKDLMAVHGFEIQRLASVCGVTVHYEASVGGAIPLIRPLKECLTANDILDIVGIVNGTTNYILSKMSTSGMDFESVLAEAQSLGYAESDPSSDVDGLDAARKLVLLSSLAFGCQVELNEVPVQGIRSITASDVAYASELECVIKLLAQGTHRDGDLVLQVRPTLVPKHHPLAAVADANNALFIRGDAAGELMFYGQGAGSLPTASAMVGDVIAVLRQMQLHAPQPASPLHCEARQTDASKAAPSRHYIRLRAANVPGAFSQVAKIFGDAEVSMETVLQKRQLDENLAEIVIVTEEATPVQMDAIHRQLRELKHVEQICNILPFAS